MGTYDDMTNYDRSSTVYGKDHKKQKTLKEIRGRPRFTHGEIEINTKSKIHTLS